MYIYYAQKHFAANEEKDKRQTLLKQMELGQYAFNQEE